MRDLSERPQRFFAGFDGISVGNHRYPAHPQSVPQDGVLSTISTHRHHLKFAAGVLGEGLKAGLRVVAKELARLPIAAVLRCCTVLTTEEAQSPVETRAGLNCDDPFRL